MIGILQRTEGSIMIAMCRVQINDGQELRV